MDAQALLLLVDIVEAGNLSLAARKLKTSRANVSYRLKQFEHALGMQLIRRTTRRIEATELGLTLYRHGCTVRDALRAAQESVNLLGRGLHGTVRMSLPTGFGELVMTDWLLEFKRRYPDIALELHFDNRVDDLLREEIDVAVRVMSEPPPQMVAIELAHMHYVLCAAAEFAHTRSMPSTLEDLAALPILTSNVDGRELRVSAYRDTERRELSLRPTLASENFRFLRDAVLAGLGVGLVPDYVLAREIADGSVVTALDDWRLSIFGTRLFLLRMPNRYQTLAARTLTEFVVEHSRSRAPD